MYRIQNIKAKFEEKGNILCPVFPSLNHYMTGMQKAWLFRLSFTISACYHERLDNTDFLNENLPT